MENLIAWGLTAKDLAKARLVARNSSPAVSNGATARQPRFPSKRSPYSVVRDDTIVDIWQIVGRGVL
jgi:hypothetical protein